MRKLLHVLACMVLLLFFVNVAALDAPTLSSPTHPSEGKWYNQRLIKLEWEPVEGATRYYYTRDSNPDTVPTSDDDYIEDNSLSFSIGKGAIYYFHVSAARGTSLGPASHYEVRLDLTRPDWSGVSPLKATATEDGYLALSWEDAVDEESGIDYYTIFRDAKFDFDVRAASRRYSPIFGTSHLDTNNMSQQITFFYIVVAVDKASNQSRLSNKASATTYAFCDINVLFDAALSDDQQNLLISIQADQNLYSATLVASLPGGETTEFFRNTAVSDYNTAFDLSETPEGVIKIDLTAQERLGDDCSQSKEFIYDVTPPSVEITAPELNETVSEAFEVRVKAFDNGDYKSGISSVEFFVRTEDWNSLGEMSPDGNGTYSIDWNTFNFTNGRHQIKAIAEDAVGNRVEDSSGAIVFNTLYQRGDADAAIGSAEISQQNALDFVDSLAKQNVSSESISSLLASADSNLSNARELYDVGGNEYTNSRAFAKKAQELFDSVEGAVSVEKTSEHQFVYNQEQVSILLNASPLDKGLVPEAQQLIELASPQRMLEMIKVTDGNNVYYRANIVVSFSLAPNYLAENDLNFLNILEFVPKEFAPDAEQIYSYYDFSIIEGDPVIQFRVDSEQLAAGQVSYGLDRDLTEGEANAMLESNTVNKYLVPPVLLRAALAIGSSGFSLPIGEIPFDLNFALILGIVIVGVVAVAIVLGLLLYSKRKKGNKIDLSIFE